MTLQEAIAEVRRHSNLSLPQETIQQILNAVASGDLIPKADAGAASTGPFSSQPGEVPASSAPALIPKADADLAIAEALRTAGEVVEEHFPGTLYASNRTKVIADINRIANQDHLAGVTAMRADLEATRRLLMAEADASLERLARAEAAEAEVTRLREALVEARDEAHSLAHNEYDGVWNEQDFANLTPLADAALTRKGEPT
jgi:hypothetical protein